jgi:hypothetical protein
MFEGSNGYDHLFAESHLESKRPFGTRRQERVERRRSKRDKLAIAMSLYSIAQSRVVSMVDVSQSGARIAGHNLPQAGKDVLLKIDDVELFGTIVRVSESEAAMKFDRPIGPGELERLRAVLEEQEREARLRSL